MKQRAIIGAASGSPIRQPAGPSACLAPPHASESWCALQGGLSPELHVRTDRAALALLAAGTRLGRGGMQTSQAHFIH